MPSRQLGRAAVAASFALATCGSVGDPLPPLANLPTPISDLAARQVGHEILISWTWPATTTEGTIARRLGVFTLWAVDVPGFGDPLAPDTIDSYRREALRVEPSQLGGQGPGSRVNADLPLSAWKLGQETVLAMTASNRSGRDAGYSNQVWLDPWPPPQAPDWAEVGVQANGVALAWRAGDHAEEHDLERAKGEDGKFERLGRLAGGSFLDRTAVWGNTYRYRLRSLRASRAGWIEGGLSRIVEVDVRDTFPPPAPRDLRAVGTPTSVELSWRGAGDDKPAAYLLYRDGEAVSPLLTGTTASTAPVGDRAVQFWVTAVDGAGNESPPSDPVTVRPGGSGPQD